MLTTFQYALHFTFTSREEDSSYVFLDRKMHSICELPHPPLLTVPCLTAACALEIKINFNMNSAMIQ